MECSLSNEERKNHNRIITVIIFAMFITAWVLINSREFLLAAFLYIVLGLISIPLYLIWNKF